MTRFLSLLYSEFLCHGLPWGLACVCTNGRFDRFDASGYIAFQPGRIAVQNGEFVEIHNTRDFRVTVDQVGTLTGYDLFDQVGAITELSIERRRDRL